MKYVANIDAFIDHADAVVKQEIAKMNKRVEQAGDVVYENVKRRASLTDHTQADLDALGHPYSTAFPEDYKIPHGDDGLLHIQTGELYNAIEKDVTMSDNETVVDVGVNVSKVGEQKIREIVEGTPRKRPRPFLRRGFAESEFDVKAVLTMGGGS